MAVPWFAPAPTRERASSARPVWNADLLRQDPDARSRPRVAMTQINLADKLVDVIGEDVFAPDPGFGTITDDVRCRTNGLIWLGHNCSIAVAEVSVLSSGASMERATADWKTTTLGKTGRKSGADRIGCRYACGELGSF